MAPGYGGPGRDFKVEVGTIKVNESDREADVASIGVCFLPLSGEEVNEFQRPAGRSQDG